MAFNPLPIFIITLSTLVFQALIFGEEYAEKSFPEYEEFALACNDDDTSFFSGMLCFVQTIGYGLRVLLGVILFIWDLISWNIPGAPWYIRVVAGGINGMGLLWSTVTLFRGN